MSSSTNRSGLTQLQGYTTSYVTSPVNLGTSWRQISIGNQFALGIKSNNLLYAWGRNDSGQLGTSDLLSRSSPAQVGTFSWNSVSAGGSHALGIRSDNLMFGWGLNSSNQTGNVTDPASYQGFFKYLSNGYNASQYFIKSDNTLYAVGNNANGQLGDSTLTNRSSPVQIGSSLYSIVQSTGDGALALTIDGRLFAWGQNTYGTNAQNNTITATSPIQVKAGTSFTTISVNGVAVLALDTAGKLWAWGFNNNGALGDGTTITRSSPVQIAADKSWRTILQNGINGYGIDVDYNLWGWGNNTYGQLCQNDTIHRSSPVQINAGTSWVQLGSSTYNIFALASNGFLYGAGYNQQGQLGDGTTISRSGLTYLGTYNTSMYLPRFSSLGSMYCFVYNGNVYATGRNSVGQLGDGTTIDRSTPVQITSTGDYTMATIHENTTTYGIQLLRNNGSLYSAGQEAQGYYGSLYPYYTQGTTAGYATTAYARSSPVQIAGSTNIVASPTQIGTSSWSQVSAGFNHSMAIRSDRTLWGWGNNTQGQTLVTSGPLLLSSPTQVGSSSYISVSAGNQFTMAINNDYKIVSGGNNQFGQLGIGSNVSATGYSWSQLESGIGFTVAIRNDKTLWAWGINSAFGRLATGDTIDRSSPVQIGASSWSFVSAGTSHIAAITMDGRVFTWGNNANGQLGDGTTISRSSPVQISTARSFITLSAGATQTFFIDNTYNIWGTGSNGSFELGDVSNINRSNPVQLTNSTFQSFAQVAAAATGALALGTDGSLWGWGANDVGQLGDNTATFRSFPVKVTTSWTAAQLLTISTSYSQIHAGKVQKVSYAVDNNGYLWSWGTGVSYLNGTLGGVSVSVPGLVNGGARVSKIVLSSSNTNPIIVKTNGTLWAWGVKTTALTSDVNTTTLTYSWIQIAGNGQATRVLRHDYNMWSSGLNTSGQLGDSSTASRSSPVQIATTTNSWSSIGSAYQNYFVTTYKGQLFGSGPSNNGELLGLGSPRSAPIQIAAYPISWNSVAGGVGYVAGIATDGSLYKWGTTNFNVGGNNSNYSWTQIYAGQANAPVMIRNDGSLFGMGTHGNNNDSSLAWSPVQLGADSWIQVSTGQEYSGSTVGFGIKNNYTLWAWGVNTNGTLGDGTTISRSSPVQIPGSWTKVAAANIPYAIKTDGTLWALGGVTYNSPAGFPLGILPNPPDRQYFSTPVQVLSGSWTSISTNYYSNFGGQLTAAIDTASRLYVWGDNQYGAAGTFYSPIFVSAASINFNSYYIDKDNILYASGFNSAFAKPFNNNLGYFGQPITTFYSRYYDAVYLPSSSTTQYKISQVVPVNTFSSTYFPLVLLITTDNKLLVYGTPGNSNYTNPVPAFDYLYDTSSWVSVIATVSGAMALRSDNTIFAWGYSLNGELMSNDTAQFYQAPFAPVTAKAISKLIDFTSGAISGYIDTDGRAYVAGINTSGQLGDGTVVSRSSPIQVNSGNSFTFMSASHFNIYLIRTDGVLMATGPNNNGQIGDGTTVAKSSPVQVGAYKWSKVLGAEQAQYTIGLLTNGTLWTWGSNAYGVLGDNTTVSRSSPVQIGTSTYIDIGYWTNGAGVAGVGVTLAIRNDNTLWAWGGTNSITFQNAIGGPQWQQISTGTSFSAMIDDLGRLYTMGVNTFGQLGDGTVISRSSPVQVGTSSWLQVSCGSNHTVALRADNTVWAWGGNGAGQLGDSTIVSKSSPILVTISPSVWVAAGPQITAFILNGGALYTVGSNTNGALGDNTIVSKSNPIQVGSAIYKEVYIGGTYVNTNEFTYARQTNDTLWAWGYNVEGQLGDGTTIRRSSPVQIASNISSMALTGNVGGVYLDTSYRLFTWGNNQFGSIGDGTTVSKSSPTQLGTSSYTSIGSGYGQVFALTSDNKLWQWGWNAVGELGDGTTISRSSPVQVLGTSYTQLNSVFLSKNSMGTHYGFRAGNTSYLGLFVSGSNTGGQIGDGTTTSRSAPAQIGFYANRSSPVQLGTGTFTNIYSYSSLATVLKHTDGSLWGITGPAYALGVGDTVYRYSLTKFYTNPVNTISFSQSTGYLIESNYQMKATGVNSGYQFGYVSVASTSWVPIGKNSFQNLKQLFVGESITQVAAVGETFFVIKQNATLWGWGRNDLGQLGQNDTISRSSPVQVPGSYSQIKAEDSFTMAIKTDGTLWAWGTNSAGNLGDNTIISKSSPIQVTAGTGSWIQVSIYGQRVIAIGSNKLLWGWGLNTYGTVGVNDTVSRSSPTQVGALTWVQAEQYGNHCAGVVETGAVYAWGLNQQGQLGDGTTINRSSPVQIGASGYQFKLARGSGASNNTIFVRNGDLYGTGTYQVLGDPALTGNRSAPAQITRAVNYTVSPIQVSGSWNSVSVGNRTILGIDTTNKLYVWGNESPGPGSLTGGPGYLSISNTPHDNIATTTTGLLGFIKSNGTLWMLGFNTSGQIGDGTTVSRSSPVQIGTEANWLRITTGTAHTLALKQDGSLWSWGSNFYGQLGLNDTVYRSSPVQVTTQSWTYANNTSKFVQVAGFWTGSYAIDVNNKLYAWGANDVGQLGDNTTVTKSSPIFILTGVSKVFTSSLGQTVHIIKTDGTLWGWGQNNLGQLGDGTTVTRSSPVQISSLTDWSMIAYRATAATGTSFTQATHAVKTDGSLWGWGKGDLGENLLGTGVSNSSPIQVSSANVNGLPSGVSWLAVYSGQYATYALASNYNLFVWSNPNTSLNSFMTWNSNGTTTTNYPKGYQMTAIPMKAYSNWEHYRLGMFWPNEQNQLYGWGQNTTGYLGDSTTVSKSSPVVIAGVGNINLPNYTPLLVNQRKSWTVASAGQYFNLAIDNYNVLYSWGSNTQGQLGHGTTVSRSSPVQTGTSNLTITDFGGGTSHFVYIRSDNNVFVWGKNNFGQLGDGTTIDRSSPYNLGSGYVKVAKGSGNNTYLLTSAGTGNLWTVGENTNGQLGDNTTVNKSTLTQIVTLLSFSQIGAGFGITSTGSLWGWGLNTTGQIGDNTTINRSSPVQIGALANWSKLPQYTDVTSSVRFAINTSGQLFGWGLNAQGQLGLLDTVNRSSPVQVGTGNSFTLVSVGPASTFAIRTDTQLFAWGRNNEGQLGDSTTISKSSPVQITNSLYNLNVNQFLNVMPVGSSSQTTVYATDVNQNLWAWGDNSRGQFGNNTTVSSSSPALVTNAGNNYGWQPSIQLLYGSGSDGTTGITTFVSDSSNTLYAWGSNNNNLIGLSTVSGARSSPVQVNFNNLNSYISASAGSSNSMALRSTYILETWGNNANGQLGDGTLTLRSSPVQIGSTSSGVLVNTLVGTPTKLTTQSYTSISAGSNHALALQTTGLAVGWGQSNWANFGDNTYEVWSSVIGGASDGAAISSSGKLFTWGYNLYGQVGDSTTVDKLSPVSIGNDTWTSISTGQWFKLAIKSDGSLWAWGLNNYGQLGDGSTINKSSPVQVGTVKNWYKVEAYRASAMGLYMDGSLFTWGFNTNGELGLNDTVNRSSPVQVGSSSFLILGSAGQGPGAGATITDTMFAIDINYRLFAWGYGNTGLIGVGDTISRSSPIQIDTGFSYTQVTHGQTHALALRIDKLLYAWGSNTYGGVGNNTTISRSAPEQIVSRQFKKIAAGLFHSLAIDFYDNLWAWGLNSSGQMGDNSTNSRSSPVQVGTSAWNTISAFDNGSRGIYKDYTLAGWGSAYTGNINTTSSSSPVVVDLSSVLLGTATSQSSPVQIGSYIPQNYYSYRSGPGDTTGNTINFNSAFNTGSGSFTVEVWVYTIVTGAGNQTLFSIPNTGLSVALNNNLFIVLSSTGTVGFTATSTTAVSVNTWTHICIQRDSSTNTGYFYINGTQTNSFACSFDFTKTTTSSYVFLGSGSGTENFRGFFSNFRYVKALVYSVGGFTSPTSPLSNIANTVLLTAQDTTLKDNSSNSWTITGPSRLPGLIPGATNITPFSVPSRVSNNSSYSVVSAGHKHSMAIKPDGTLWGWGINADGQVGVRSSLTTIYQLNDSAYIRTSDKALFVWGDNTVGGVGDYTVVSRSVPVQIFGSWLMVASAGGSQNTVGRSKHTFAIDSTYRLYGWGRNTNGELANNSTINRSSPQLVAATRYTKIFSGNRVQGGLKEDGTLWIWGYNGLGGLGDGTTINKSTPIQILPNQISFSDANDHLAVRPEGFLWAWGNNSVGQVGDGSTANRSSPVQIGFHNNWLKTYTSNNGGWSWFGAAITKAGILYMWGANGAGQIGDNTTVSRSSPVQISTTQTFAFVTQIGVTEGVAGSTFAIDTLGRLWSWGLNTNGQLGLNDIVSRSSPVQVGSSSWITVGGAGASVWAIDINNQVYAWGYNNTGVLGFNDTIARSTPTQISGLSGKAVTGGNNVTGTQNSKWAYLLDMNNNIRVVGDNQFGNLGTNSVVATSTFTLLSTDVSYSQIAGGVSNGLAIATPGYLRAIGGNNFEGQLGLNDTIARSSPVNIGTTAMSYIYVTAGVDTNSHVFAIKDDYTLYAWGGNNQAGQLGVNNTIARSTPVQIPGSWSLIRTNGANVVGIQTNNTLWVWGLNAAGQLGQNDTIARSSPVQIAGSYTDATIAGTVNQSSNSITAFRKTDGTWWATGYNVDGGLGDNTTISRSSPVQLGGGKSYTIVSGGGGGSAGTYGTKFNAIDNVGQLWGWGPNSNSSIGDDTASNRSSPVQVGASPIGTLGTGSWVQLSNNETATWGVYRENNQDFLYSWGTNWSGQLGDGTTTDRTRPTLDSLAAFFTNSSNVIIDSPVQIGVGYSWLNVSTGSYATLALRSDYTLWAWGQNAGGQLGQTDILQRSQPTQIGPGTAYQSWINIKASGNYIDNDTMFGTLATTGLLYGWGYNNYGQLGDTTTVNRSTPAQIITVTIGAGPLPNPIRLTSTTTSSFSLVSTQDSAVFVTSATGLAYAWGLNTTGQLGINDILTRSTPVQLGNNSTQIYQAGTNLVGNSSWSNVSAGYSHSVGIKSDGTIWGWGNRVGTGLFSTSLSWTQIVISSQFFFGIRSDSTVWVRGTNSRGGLGLGDTVTRSTLTQLPGSWSFIDSNIDPTFQVPSSMGIKTDGTLYTWGSNQIGNLGDNTTIDRSSPVQIPGSYIAASSGGRNMYVIKTDGSLWAWGLNTQGTVGDGTANSRSSPVQIGTGTSFISVSAGGSHAVAIDTSYNIYTWGYGANGQLGDTATTNRLQPTQIPSTGSVKFTARQVYAGNISTFAIKLDGTLWSWGNNANGELGQNDTTNKSSPVQVGTSFWSTVSGPIGDNGAPVQNFSAIDVNNNLYVWGQNNLGQLGDGTTVNKSSPVQISTNYPVKSLPTRNGYGVGAYIDSLQQLFITGDNSNYILGDGTTINRSSYTQLGAPGVTVSDSSPVQITAGSWTRVTAGNDTTLGVASTGLLYAWGRNDQRQTNPASASLVTLAPTNIITNTISSNVVSMGNNTGGAISNN